MSNTSATDLETQRSNCDTQYFSATHRSHQPIFNALNTIIEQSRPVCSSERRNCSQILS